ncbi:MAG: RNA polymerase sigma-70 factor (ECF subfamily) [Enterobacterales bacterium]|jgi:RNA polymerase sigma-70 factor (ECF subfamily)
MHVNRHIKSNIVYWPTSNSVRRNNTMTKPLNSEVSVIDWREYMLVVSEQRDRSAFQALYTHFSPKIKSFYLSQGLNAMAEELTHEVFIKVWQKAASYNPEKANVSTWIFTIVRNLRIDYLRRKRLIEISDEDTVEVSEDNTLDLDIDFSRNKKNIQQILSGLSEEQRNVIQKVYFEDKSHQIAAEELYMTPGTVKSRIRSALKVLRLHMVEK